MRLFPVHHAVISHIVCKEKDATGGDDLLRSEMLDTIRKVGKSRFTRWNVLRG